MNEQSKEQKSQGAEMLNPLNQKAHSGPPITSTGMAVGKLLQNIQLQIQQAFTHNLFTTLL